MGTVLSSRSECFKPKQQYEKTPTKALEKEIARCNNIQMAKKISLNSAYGAIGNQYFRYYKLANAEAITLSGQVSIRWIEGKMNEYLNKLLSTTEEDYVIASDTDSIYLNLGPLVDKFFSNKSGDKAKVVSNYLIRSVVTSWNHSSTNVTEDLAERMYRHMIKKCK